MIATVLLIYFAFTVQDSIWVSTFLIWAVIGDFIAWNGLTHIVHEWKAPLRNRCKK